MKAGLRCLAIPALSYRIFYHKKTAPYMGAAAYCNDYKDTSYLIAHFAN